MKFILCLTVLVSANSWSQTIKNFNKALQEDVQKEIKDDDKFKKDMNRTPASVEVEKEPMIDEPSKMDKNVRQIGPNKW
jgi:hypothetical protein